MVACALAVLASACGAAGPREPSLFERAALARGRAELGCADPELFVEPLGAGGYRVRGCDTYVTYTCLERYSETPGTRGQVICSLSEREARPADETRSRRDETDGTWTDAEIQALAARVRPALELCLSPGEDVSLELLAGGTGGVRRVNELASPALTECADAALAEHSLEGERSRPRRFALRARGR